MDTLKIGTYSDVPDNLEKGCPSVEPCHTQPAPLPPRSFLKRHWVAFGAVAFIWLMFSHGWRAFWHTLPPHIWWENNGVGSPLPPDGDIEKCVDSTNWTTYYENPPWIPEYPYGAETTFSLPLDSDAFHLVSRGPHQRGLVKIEQSSQVADTVEVRVRVAYSNDVELALASVCQIKRADREYGIGIFTPPWPRSPRRTNKNELEFDVTLTFPSASEVPLSVKKLETRMPDYIQNVADLKESVVFDQISLESANGRISVQSLTAEVGRFSSVNGEIDGHFNARTFLYLHTVNGRIVPTVNLSHHEGEDPSILSIGSINGEINAEISLLSEAQIGGEFTVDAKSTNGEIKLKFINSSVGSELQCQAETTVGGIQVELDRAFEGTYSLENVLSPKLVLQHDVEDPAGRGRHRAVSVSERPGRVLGEVRWVEGDGSISDIDGHVVLKTVVSPVKLII